MSQIGPKGEKNMLQTRNVRRPYGQTENYRAPAKLSPYFRKKAFFKDTESTHAIE